MAYTSRASKGKPLTIAELDNNFMCHYPLGSIYLNAMDNRSPHELIGYGSWSPYAQGLVLLTSDEPRVPDGIGALGGFGNSPDHTLNIGNATIGSTVQNSPDYYSPGFEGGLPSVKLNSSTVIGTALPEHRHYWASSYNNQAGGDSYYSRDGRDRFRCVYNGFRPNTDNRQNGLSGPESTVITLAGGEDYTLGDAGGTEQHNNIQPYITVNMWVRKK